jgi:hypothetical protein
VEHIGEILAAHLGRDLVNTLAGSTTVRATSATTLACSSLLTSTLKISRISTLISTWNACAMPAAMVFMRSRIMLRTLSENARTVPDSTASLGMTL